jgi:D-amino-acid dehydrogenase
MREAGCEDLLQKRGQLFVHESANGAVSGGFALDLRERHGVRVEFLDAGEIRDLEPALAPIFNSAVFLPDQGQCPNPGRLVARLAALAARNGARFHRGRVAGFERTDGRVTGVRLEDGTIRHADQFVIAAGAWSTHLSRQLGDRIPFESERGYHVMVRGADTGLKVQTISADRKFVLSQMEEGLRIAGNVEFSGLESPPNMARADALLSQARPMFRNLEVGEVTRWMGHRPGTPDSIPVIDRAARAPNVLYAFGHGHQGLIGGAVTGKVIAEMASGQPTSVDITPFRRDRF